MKITITNTNGNPITYQFNAIFIEEGYVSIKNGVVDAQLGVLTEEEVLNAEPSNMTFDGAKHVLGGFSWASLWKNIKKFIGTAARDKSVQHLIRKGINKGINKGFEYTSKLGEGMHYGRGLVGGRYISRDEI